MSRRQLGGLILIITLLLWSQDGGGINPFVPVDPSPIDTKTRMALIVYESADLTNYPYKQAAAFRSEKLLDYLSEKCDKDEDGNPLFRIWDKDVDLTYVDDIWKKAMEVPRDTLPWVVVTNGKGGASTEMPPDTDSTIELLKKYLE